MRRKNKKTKKGADNFKNYFLLWMFFFSRSSPRSADSPAPIVVVMQSQPHHRVWCGGLCKQSTFVVSQWPISQRYNHLIGRFIRGVAVYFIIHLDVSGASDNLASNSITRKNFII